MEENKAIPTPVAGNWADQKNKLKGQFPTLTDADLHFEEGKKEEMLTRVQAKLGKTKVEFDTIISKL
ncbi:general stress protein CsbD [Flavobacterium sp. SM15]|uniref:general stress protein CsbD n=1 Tax=Flavobacterium sp. SM15 TaxID=2908005 RepID=UPI001EDB6397|nr:general stress protein CsbD [Flavobacterium sp. SM15]MCG2610004.1 general stress protein CsbD [Flavobacterium sp. SM15]